MTEVERFDVSKVPDHGRPRVVEFSAPEGRLALHVSREDGSLWLFGEGPRGGQHGPAVFPLSMAERMLTWLDGGAQGAAPSTMGVVWLDRNEDERKLVIKKDAMHQRGLTMPFDSNAVKELTTALREWATLVASRGARIYA